MIHETHIIVVTIVIMAKNNRRDIKLHTRHTY